MASSPRHLVENTLTVAIVKQALSIGDGVVLKRYPLDIHERAPLPQPAKPRNDVLK